MTETVTLDIDEQDRFTTADLSADFDTEKDWALLATDYDDDSKFGWICDRDERWLSTTVEDNAVRIGTDLLSAGDIFRINADPPNIYEVISLDTDAGKITLLPLSFKEAVNRLQSGERGISDDSASEQSNGSTQSADTAQTDADMGDDASTETEASGAEREYTSAADRSMGELFDRKRASGFDTEPSKEADPDEVLAHGELGSMATTSEALDDKGRPTNKFDNPESTFGYVVFFTAGSTLYVPREELIQKMQSLDLPDALVPGKVSGKQAYKRAMNTFFDPNNFPAERSVGGYDTVFEIDSPDQTSSTIFHLLARKYIPPSRSDIEGGEYETVTVGTFSYNEDAEIIEGRLREEAQETIFEPLWGSFLQRARDQRQMHRICNSGTDLVQRLSNTNAYFDSERAVSLRRAVYFVPQRDETTKTLQGLTELFQWMDENYKNKGSRTQLAVLPVRDAENIERMVEDSVREELEGEVDDIFETINRAIADDEKFARDVAETVLERLAGEVKEFEQDYNDIIKGKISVQNIIEEKMTDVEDKHRDDLEEILEEQGVINPANTASNDSDDDGNDGNNGDSSTSSDDGGDAESDKKVETVTDGGQSDSNKDRSSSGLGRYS